MVTAATKDEASTNEVTGLTEEDRVHAQIESESGNADFRVKNDLDELSDVVVCHEDNCDVDEKSETRAEDPRVQTDGVVKATTRRAKVSRQTPASASNDDPSVIRMVSGKRRNGARRNRGVEENEGGTFCCKQCEKQFGSRQALSLHMRYHVDRSHECGICGKKFKNQFSLNLHMKSHLNMREYECEKCGKAFNTKNAYVVHVNRHEDVKRHCCPYCPKSFAQKYQMTVHIQGHLNRREFKCPVCAKAFNAKVILNKHLETHSKSNVFTCETCGKTFNRQYNLTQHLKSHMDLKEYKCTECGRGFNTSVSLQSHMVTHQPDMNFACEICGKTFKRRQNMRMHVLTHSDEKPYKCSICGKGHNSTSSLSSHKKVHIAVKSIPCDFCDRMFTTEKYKRRHMVTHSEVKPHQCPNCGKGFYSTAGLYDHKKSCTSEGLRCSVCGDVIKGGKKVFLQHMRTHPVQFACEFCNRTFTTKELWRRHRDIHLNERRYKCTECDKAFNTSSQVWMHKSRVHKSEAERKKEDAAEGVTDVAQCTAPTPTTQPVLQHALQEAQHVVAPQHAVQQQQQLLVQQHVGPPLPLKDLAHHLTLAQHSQQQHTQQDLPQMESRPPAPQAPELLSPRPQQSFQPPGPPLPVNPQNHPQPPDQLTLTTTQQTVPM